MITLEGVQSYLARLIGEAMYMEQDEIREDELFSNFGLESLTLVRLVAKVNQQYAVAINARGILKYQTLRAAAAFIFQELNAQAGQKDVTHAL